MYGRWKCKDEGHPKTGQEGPGRIAGIDGVGGQRHAAAALPSGKTAVTHCTGGGVGPRTGLDGCEKSRPHRNSIAEPLARSEWL